MIYIRLHNGVNSKFCQRYSRDGFVGLDSVEIALVDVTPAPVFPTLRRLDDGVLGVCRMGARVTVFRGVTTADVSTLKAHAQMDPGITGFEAVFAAL